MNLENLTIGAPNPRKAFLRKVYLIEVARTVDGDILKVFNFIPINMGAAARPILTTWTIWMPQRGTFNTCLLNINCLNY